MPANTHQLLPEKSEFETLFEQLAGAWLSHQELKTAGAPLSDLATSNAQLFQARIAMGCWRRWNRS